MRDTRAKGTIEKMLSKLVLSLADDIVKKVEKKKAVKESNRKRKALQRENETEEEMNHRMDKAVLYHRQKSKELLDPVDKWIERRKLELEQHRCYVNPKYIDKTENVAVEKYFAVKELNRKKKVWLATIPDE